MYQHDTPDKYLFAKDERAYSHGCMRVQYPDQYAAVLLGITVPNEHYTAEKIRGMYGHSEIDIKFPTPVPVNSPTRPRSSTMTASYRSARTSMAATPTWRRC